MLPAAQADAGEFCVDKNNTTGVEDGTAQKPYNTIQEAVAAATGGGEHTIRVAQGEYNEDVVIDAATVHLLGGFAGGSTADYEGGAGGIFDQQDPVTHVTQIRGAGARAVVVLMESGTSTLDGFVITGGTGYTDSHRYMGGGIYVYSGSPTLSRNIIDGNDARHNGSNSRGGGIAAEDASVHIINNTIKNNFAGLGGGIHINGGDVVIEGNTVQNNTATEDHGGGLYLSGNSLTITGNRVLENIVGQSAGYGWGGGIAVIGEETSAVLSDNLFSGNYAPSAGGGVFIDDGADATLDHELIVKNQCGRRGGAGVWVDGIDETHGSTSAFSHCTIADNQCIGESGCEMGGAGLLVEASSVATVENCIFWGNGGDDFHKDNTSQITITYTDSEETVAGTGNFSSNPFFADPTNSDYHLQSTAGRWDSAGSGGAGAWVVDLNQSPCIDKGNPASGFGNEPIPNGGRVNMGVYGNTAEASKSPAPGCPVCSGSDVVIDNYSYQPGSDCECTAASSITLGPNVIVGAGAKVRLRAPRVHFKSEVDVEAGADVRATPF